MNMTKRGEGGTTLFIYAPEEKKEWE